MSIPLLDPLMNGSIFLLLTWWLLHLVELWERTASRTNEFKVDRTTSELSQASSGWELDEDDWSILEVCLRCVEYG